MSKNKTPVNENIITITENTKFYKQYCLYGWKVTPIKNKSISTEHKKFKSL